MEELEEVLAEKLGGVVKETGSHSNSVDRSRCYRRNWFWRYWRYWWATGGGGGGKEEAAVLENYQVFQLAEPAVYIRCCPAKEPPCKLSWLPFI